MSELLEYQQEIYRTILEGKDGLVILSPGLGLSTILAKLVELYATREEIVDDDDGEVDEGSKVVVEEGEKEERENRRGERRAVYGLVFLVNAEWPELTPFLEEKTEFITVDSGTPAVKREALYRQGGMIAITSRILVVDLLSDRVPVPLVTGFLIANAHQIHPHSAEAFILRIFRQQNKLGFIKAFSDRPDLFVAGFAPLERTMKLLFLRTAYLWPRFQVEVAQCLEAHPIQVIELHQPLSKKMQMIQASIMDCLNNCLMELRRSKLLKEVEEDLTLDNALSRNFDRMLRNQLESVWYRLGFSTRELISDVAVLRQLLTYLTQYDSVSFLKYVDTVLALNSAGSQKPGATNQPSAWLMTDAANALLLAARSRVFTKQGAESIPVLEEQPKWKLVRQLIDEVKAKVVEKGEARIMIFADGARSCRMIRDYLRLITPEGERHPMLTNLYRNYKTWKCEIQTVGVPLPRSNPTLSSSLASNVRRPPASKRRRVRGGGNGSSGGHQTTIPLWANSSNPTRGDPDSQVDTPNSSGEIVVVEPEELPSDVTQFDHGSGLVPEVDDIDVMIQSLSGDLDDLALVAFRPTHIIIADPDPALIRRIEVYQATLDYSLTVYFLMYSDSVEEQRFLASVRREKDGFERLIREKANVVIPLDYGLTRTSIERIIDTRIAGGQALGVPRVQVVVDVREFRAALPSALHAAGLEIVPVTLQIGDYILAPTLCVERKAIPDLISSITSGRLYTQVEMMSAFYATPILLIEFDENKSFSLEVMGDQGSEFYLANIPSKLVLLSLTFPKLKIIWSSSPAQTAQIFIDLKNGLPEPDVDTCVSLGQSEEGALDQASHTAPVSLLRTLPGITPTNYHSVMRAIPTIQTLTTTPLPTLQSLIGQDRGRKLFNFINGVD